MNSQNKKTVILIVILLVTTNIATYFLTVNGMLSFDNSYVLSTHSATGATEAQKLLDLDEVIQSRYYQDVDETALMENAIKGMFSAIGDKYSAYYTKDEFTALMESSTGTYEGIGVTVTEDDSKNTVVVSAFKDSPAGNAGMVSNDVIVKVDGEDVQGKGMDYVVSKMRGTAGTKVSVTVSRNGEEKTFDLTREAIDEDTVASQVLYGDVGYIQITQFTEKTADDFKSQLSDLQSKGIKYLIIDLRDNGGGLVDSSVAVADRLLGDTEVVYTVDKSGKRQDYKSTADVKLDLPMVVLVNGGTASASEILSGAIQDTAAGTLIGTKTFGKGIVQEIHPLSDGSGYKLTIAQYFTPKGRNIHGVGLTPDITVEQNDAYKDSLYVPQDQDTQLQKALETLKGTSSQTQADTTSDSQQ